TRQGGHALLRLEHHSFRSAEKSEVMTMFSFKHFNLDAIMPARAPIEDFDLDIEIDLSSLDTIVFEPQIDTGLANSFGGGSASATGVGSASASFFGTASGSGSSSVSASAYAYVAPDGSSFSSVSGSASGDSFFGTGTAQAGGDVESFSFSSVPFEPIAVDLPDLEPIVFDVPDFEPVAFDFSAFLI
ncbi:MAG: hypothetical protein AAF293_17110, partial [Pseudomonadota bacterium]